MRAGRRAPGGIRRAGGEGNEGGTHVWRGGGCGGWMPGRGVGWARARAWTRGRGRQRRGTAVPRRSAIGSRLGGRLPLFVACAAVLPSVVEILRAIASRAAARRGPPASTRRRPGTEPCPAARRARRWARSWWPRRRCLASMPRTPRRYAGGVETPRRRARRAGAEATPRKPVGGDFEAGDELSGFGGGLVGTPHGASQTGPVGRRVEWRGKTRRVDAEVQRGGVFLFFIFSPSSLQDRKSVV